MDKNEFNQYLESVDRANCTPAGDMASRQEVLRTIQSHLTQVANDTRFEPFFLGEQAFFSGDFRSALKYYLDAKSIPNAPFFCYRTSAYALKEQGQIEKAIGLAKNALKLRPNDKSTLDLLGDLLKMHHESTSDPTQNDAMMPTLHNVAMQEDQNLALAELQALASQETGTTTQLKNPINAQALTDFINEQLGLDVDLNFSLEQRIATFARYQEELVGRYVGQYQLRATPPADGLLVLQGWEEAEAQTKSVARQMASWQLARYLLPEQFHKTAGGYFLRWKGMGVALNPGPSFLENMHAHGLHIRDIDVVIVTQDTGQAKADVRAIYELNAHYNRASQELHVINYYFNPRTYRTLAGQLKPQFKQERGTVHCLELYMDSHGVETMSICDMITLRYFHATAPSTMLSEGTPDMSKEAIVDNIGVVLRLHGATQTQNGVIHIGMISGMPWSSILPTHLGHCDVLIAGFGRSSVADCSKVKHNSDSLGFFGTASLLETAMPRLLLTTEYSGREGDIRLEVTKRLRTEHMSHSEQGTVVLPGDIGLFVDVDAMRARCVVTDRMVKLADLRVVRGRNDFARLSYVGTHCLV